VRQQQDLLLVLAIWYRAIEVSTTGGIGHQPMYRAPLFSRIDQQMHHCSSTSELYSGESVRRTILLVRTTLKIT
jgi:hypothetical protein